MMKHLIWLNRETRRLRKQFKARQLRVWVYYMAYLSPSRIRYVKKEESQPKVVLAILTGLLKRTQLL